jgi:hypothetical protein
MQELTKWPQVHWSVVSGIPEEKDFLFVWIFLPNA